MENKNTSVMQLFVVMATAIVGPYAAEVVGIYLLIVFAALTGAAWSMGRHTFNKRWSAVFYFLRIVCIAVLLTVGITKIMVAYMDSVEADWLVAPVALIIVLIGDEWNRIFYWCFEAVSKIANTVLNKKLEK